MSLAGAMGGHTVVAVLTLFGTEEQRRTYSAPDGQWRAAGL